VNRYPVYPRFYADLMRCPYLPGEPGYDAWNEKDKKRLAEIDKHRIYLLETAKRISYKNHSDKNVRAMSNYIIEMLEH
jgi:hypothetical protein